MLQQILYMVEERDGGLSEMQKSFIYIHDHLAAADPGEIWSADELIPPKTMCAEGYNRSCLHKLLTVWAHVHAGRPHAHPEQKQRLDNTLDSVWETIRTHCGVELVAFNEGTSENEAWRFLAKPWDTTPPALAVGDGGEESLYDTVRWWEPKDGSRCRMCGQREHAPADPCLVVRMEELLVMVNARSRITVSQASMATQDS